MALIAVAADKGAPGVTTACVALSAVWPRRVLLAECDPAGGDVVYRLPGAQGGSLDPGRGLVSLAAAARHGLAPDQVWEHTQKLRGGLDVLTGVTTAEQGAGLGPLWATVGAALSRLPHADVIADCGRIGPDGPHYGLLARADPILLLTRATLADVVRLRDRVAALMSALDRRGRPVKRVGVVVVAQHRNFHAALAEVAEALRGSGPAAHVVGGLAHEPRSADMLSGEWGGRLDKSLLIRTAREIAAKVAGSGGSLPPPPSAHQPAPLGSRGG